MTGLNVVILGVVLIVRAGALTTLKLRQAIPYLLTTEDVLRTDRSVTDDEGESIIERLEIGEIHNSDKNDALRRIRLKTEKRDISIDLEPMNRIMSPNLRVAVVDDEKIREMPIHSSMKSVFFHGMVEGINGGEASLMKDNNGWKGIVFIKGEAFAINHEESTGEHLLIKVINDDIIGATPLLSAMDRKKRSNKKKRNNEHDRRERDSANLKLELGVYTDQDLYDWLNENVADPINTIQRLVLLIVNTANIYYRKSSLGVPLEVVLAKLVIFKKDPPEVFVTDDILQYLNSFCKWQADNKNPRGLSYDLAFLLTGIDLHVLDRYAVAGIAPFGGTCKQIYRHGCAMSEGRLIVSGLIVTHEIGHSLEIYHDGDGNNCSQNTHFMGPVLYPGITDFSTCSKEDFHEYIEKLDDFNNNCLREDNSENTLNFENDLLPGERLLDNEQCIDFFGPSFTAYYNETYCSNMLCKNETYIKLSWVPPMPGSKCGENKICWNAECHNKTVVNKMRQWQYNSSLPSKPLTIDELCVKYGEDPAYSRGFGYDEALGPYSENWRGLCNEDLRCFLPDYSDYFYLKSIVPPGTPCYKDKVCKHFQCADINSPDPPIDSSDVLEVVETTEPLKKPLSLQTREAIAKFCKTYASEEAVPMSSSDCGTLLCEDDYYYYRFPAYKFSICPEKQVCTFEGACVEDSGELLPGELTKEELKEANKLCKEKYGQHSQSLCRRSALSFSLSANEYCASSLCENVACYGIENWKTYLKSFPTPEGSPCGGGKRCTPKGCRGIVIRQKFKTSSKDRGN